MLKYNIDEVIPDTISLNGVSQSFKRMMENDNEILKNVGSDINVWECRWYNNNKISGYPKGHAVWINTENVDQFIRNKYSDIEQYILNSQYVGMYSNISSNTSLTTELFRNICLGTNGYEQLYYLGDILQPVQIRVSLVDNNKELPSNSLYWADSLRLSSENDYISKITKKTVDNVNDLIYNHNVNYHLSGMTVNQLTSTYLKTDFSNISQRQSYITHSLRGRKNIDYGFDSIVKHIYVTESNRKVWFKLWSSGLLEHGGIIKINDESEYISINLNWKYQNEKVAPVYDYQIVYDGFYEENYKLNPDTDGLSIDLHNLGSQITYNVIVTPLSDNNISEECKPVELINITNNGFQVVHNSNNKAYSYYASGYITPLSLSELYAKLKT